MSSPAPRSKPTLSAHVADHLLALVKREQLRPTDQVPSEIQIGLDLKISRGSVREAYRTLAALGILEIEGGRRPRLRAIDATALAQVFGYALNTAQITVAHALETRRAVELQTAQLAARYATDAQREALESLVQQMRAAGSNHARRVECDMAIHTLIAEASANPLSALLLGALSAPVEASASMHLADTRSKDEILRVIDAHDVVVQRICAGDPVGAASAMSYHFDLAMVNVQRHAELSRAPAQQRKRAESGTRSERSSTRSQPRTA